jgi:hypothetical protein
MVIMRRLRWEVGPMPAAAAGMLEARAIHLLSEVMNQASLQAILWQHPALMKRVRTLLHEAGYYEVYADNGKRPTRP